MTDQELLRLRSEALNRVAKENEELRARAERIGSLHPYDRRRVHSEVLTELEDLVEAIVANLPDKQAQNILESDFNLETLASRIMDTVSKAGQG